MLAAPQRLEQGVAKAQRKQVLHRRFAQVMVNAEDLTLFKELAHRVVDGAVGCQVVAQRFFQHHACLGRIQPGRGQLLADCGEQGRRGGHIHDHGVGIARIQRIGQQRIVVWLGQVHAHEFKNGGKARKLLGTGALGKLHIVKARANQFAVFFIAQVVTTDADNASALGQCAVAKGLE